MEWWSDQEPKPQDWDPIAQLRRIVPDFSV
jgi:hypothetical protein